MHTRKLRWSDQTVIPHYVIDRSGRITCTMDEDMEVLYKQRCSKKGKKRKYYWHALIRRNKRDMWLAVHRLMCYSWLGEFPHPLRFICDHIDSNSLNNELWNLRYLTIRGNNLNRAGVIGVVEENGIWFPRIAGFTHKKFGHPDKEFAQLLRHNLVQSYIRYTNRCPDSDSYPHYKIHCF